MSADARRPTRESGEALQVPSTWVLVAPGDAALTRRIKSAGPAWVVKKKRGRRVMSQGVWADARTVETVRKDLEVERADPKYTKKLEAGRARRAKEQVAYVEDFRGAVFSFLAFASRYEDLAGVLAESIAEHATPVGSGTVARTKRIPVEQRAEAATIAWLRHHTTGYDDMKIARVKGKRREVRRELAKISRRLLDVYRQGQELRGPCPLLAALYPSEDDLL